MFHPVSFDIQRVDDVTIFKGIKAIASELKLTASNVDITYLARSKPARDQGHFQPVKENKGDPFNNADVEKLFAADSFDMHVIAFDLSNEIRLSVSRSLTENQQKLAPSKDNLSVEINNNQNDFVQYKQIVRACRKHFNTMDGEFLPKIIGDDLEKYYSARETSLGRLESKISEVATYFTEFRLEQENQLAAASNALVDKHATRIAELEAQNKSRQVKLDEREKELEERTKTLDDRASKHARRETYKDIKKIIKDRTTKFELTTETIKKRESVQKATFWGLIAIGVLFLICFGINMWKTEANWIAVVSQFGLAIALATLLTFYIRWQNQWFKEHANEELRLQKLDLDIDRATWLVELAMEWQNETEKEMPAEMLNKLSQSLFTDAERSTDMHPLESLISGLIDKKGEVSFKTGEFSLKKNPEGK